MEVIKAERAGFCMGVSHALTILDACLERNSAQEQPGRLFSLGPIIHNPRLVQEYEDKGAKCLKDYAQARFGDTLVIRAHGLPWQTEKTLRERGCSLIDATCPKVKAAQKLINCASSSPNVVLLLFGERQHPEVQGLVSYAQCSVTIFESLEELRFIHLDPSKAYVLAAQTTQEQEEFLEIVRYLQDEIGLTPIILHTICAATRQRQEELIKLCAKVRSMVIVGGLNSGNTTRLADIARDMGLFTIHCEGADDLSPDKLKTLQALQPIGLSAGASTPDKYIRAVEETLRNA